MGMHPVKFSEKDHPFMYLLQLRINKVKIFKFYSLML